MKPHSNLKDDPINEHLQLHIRETQFFISRNFTKFEDQLALIDRTFKPSQVRELSLKVCGYGYFENIKKKLFKNFLMYLNDALEQCVNLNRIKIIFNGFNVSEGQMSNMLKALKRVMKTQRNQPFRTFQLCTTNLRGCKRQDIKEIFSIIDQLGVASVVGCDQINIQMSDWQFGQAQGKYLTFVELKKLFENLAITANQFPFKFKKFRLQLSSCYMDAKSAYFFLKQSLKPQQIVGQIVERPQNEERQQNKSKRSSIGNINIAAIQYYLQNFDSYYLQPVYDVKKSDPRFSVRQRDAHEQKMKQVMGKMFYSQDYISKELLKHPKEYVMQVRVNQFHKKVSQFVTQLIQHMPNVHEFHIDFRNWNALFQMGILQKALEKRVISSKQQVSYMSKRNFKPTQARMQENNGQISQVNMCKTIYMM